MYVIRCVSIVDLLALGYLGSVLRHCNDFYDE